MAINHVVLDSNLEEVKQFEKDSESAFGFPPEKEGQINIISHGALVSGIFSNDDMLRNDVFVRIVNADGSVKIIPAFE